VLGLRYGLAPIRRASLKNSRRLAGMEQATDLM
jgi:hypothetical protein